SGTARIGIGATSGQEEVSPQTWPDSAAGTPPRRGCMRPWRGITKAAMALAGMALAVGLLVFAGCSKAVRHGGLPKPAPVRPPPDSDTKNPTAPPFQVWRAPRETLDIPIVFVPYTSAEWALLPDTADEPGKYWHGPSPAVPLRALTVYPDVLPPLTALSFL